MQKESENRRRHIRRSQKRAAKAVERETLGREILGREILGRDILGRETLEGKTPETSVAMSVSTMSDAVHISFPNDVPQLYSGDAKLDCICQDLVWDLDAKVESLLKTEHKEYTAIGICICPVHGRNEFESFYAVNLRGGCSMSGYRQNGKQICYTMY